MKFSLTINGQDHVLELNRENGFSCSLDGTPFEADVAEVEPGVYSLLLGSKSFKARVAPGGDLDANLPNGNAEDFSVSINKFVYAVSVRDPRRRSRGGASKPISEGKQNIKTLMPGKVVKVLVAEGQAVEGGQGLIVVEAMKMQNEIKCAKPGRVVKLLVREGQAVNAGEMLIVVE